MVAGSIQLNAAVQALGGNINGFRKDVLLLICRLIPFHYFRIIFSSLSIILLFPQVLFSSILFLSFTYLVPCFQQLVSRNWFDDIYEAGLHWGITRSYPVSLLRLRSVASVLDTVSLLLSLPGIKCQKTSETIKQTWTTMSRRVTFYGDEQETIHCQSRGLTALLALFSWQSAILPF